jgi:cysteine synthase
LGTNKVKSLIFAGVGTGGTISGVGKYLKEKNQDLGY